MAEKDDRDAELLRRDLAVEVPEIADRFRPAVRICEMAEIAGSCARPVAAMVVGVDREARSVERAREPRVAGAVLGEAVGDLYDRPRPPLRQPPPPEQRDAIVGAKPELAPWHVPPFPPAAPSDARICCRHQKRTWAKRQAGGPGPAAAARAAHMLFCGGK
jgi:hypothetical protein